MDKLKQLNQWICWKEMVIDDKPTKVPMSISGKKASTTDPSTWSSYAEVVSHNTSNANVDGIGFVFTDNDPFCGIDLDKCRNPETGEVEGWAKTIVKSFDSYTEISPSGCGLHVIIEGEKKGSKARKGRIEVYDTGRYFTVTENIFSGLDTVQERQKQLETCYNNLFAEKEFVSTLETKIIDDIDLIARAQNARNGAKFTALWNGDISGYKSRSEADLALCGLLAFWAGGDRERIDSLFKQSGLYREKWDREDYKERTINTALEQITGTYNTDFVSTLETKIGENFSPGRLVLDFHFDKNAEIAVLGIMLQNNGLIPFVCEQIGHDENAFAVSAHSTIYRAILDTDSVIDDITLAHTLREKKASEKVIASIPRLISQSFNKDNISDYCKIINRNHTKRQIVAAGKRISLIPNQDIEPDEMLVKAQAQVMTVSGVVSKRKSLREQCNKTFANLDSRGKNHIDIATGFSNFDLMTGGFHKKLFYIIAALPSAGKSALIHNMLYYISVEKQIPAVLFCYESNAEAIIKRLVSLSTNVDLSYGMAKTDRENVLLAISRISKSPLIIIDDIDPSVETAIATTQRLKAENPDLAVGVYDHMHLMTANTKEGEESVVRKISHGLKTLAKQVDMAIVGISQLSRASIRRQDPRPTLSDLRHSGALEADADLAAFLYREDYQEEQSPVSMTELIIRKQKDGETGTLHYNYHRKYSKFEEV